MPAIMAGPGRTMPFTPPRRVLSTCMVLSGSMPRRPADFGSGFTSGYDPAQDTARGPIFSRASYGVPQFYPRDLKRRVDEYVVGQDRAKKTIAAVVFNHYQKLRRCNHLEEQERLHQDKLARQLFIHGHRRFRDSPTDSKPIEGQSQHEADGLIFLKSTTGDINSNDNVAAAGLGFITRSQSHATTSSSHSSGPGPGPNAGSSALQSGYSNTSDGFPNQKSDTMSLYTDQANSLSCLADNFYSVDDGLASVKIDKSNLLLIGPTGVGKTYILETLSKKINVPFTISDCNSFTQAGYIGADVETCIERLLIEAKYDTRAAEHGIVVLDEFDKLARRGSTTSRDVGGEGVQQALLKLVEGTKITINVKDNRSSRPPVGGSSNSQPGAPPSAKMDQYTIDTSNILFVFCGAFVGLENMVLSRVARPGMGFGSTILRARPSPSSDPSSWPPSWSPASSSSSQASQYSATTAFKNVALPYTMFQHLPHQPHSKPMTPHDHNFTPLDLTTATDLQAFGFIPELIGRVHNICALAPLSVHDLLRILTEPKNSLVAQYTALFETYPSQLRFTRRALHAIAERAARSDTGARGLKMEMERVLAEPMFDAPTPYVLITHGAVEGVEKPVYWGKDGVFEIERRIRDEDEQPNSQSVCGESDFHALLQEGTSEG